jgi:hypothetical protein
LLLRHRRAAWRIELVHSTPRTSKDIGAGMNPHPLVSVIIVESQAPVLTPEYVLEKFIISEK